MAKNRIGFFCLALSVGSTCVLSACASDQKSAAAAEEVRDGEALPPAPPAPVSSAPKDEAAPAPSAASAPPASDALPAQEALTEPQMAKVSELVNTAEIEQAKLAQRRAKAPGVKQFADKMIEHHSRALREQAQIVQRLKLAPADSATAAKLKSDGETQLAKLKDASAESFDAAYITGQIDAHQQVLDLLDGQLIPNAKTADIVNALQSARFMVEQHLREARALR